MTNFDFEAALSKLHVPGTIQMGWGINRVIIYLTGSNGVGCWVGGNKSTKSTRKLWKNELIEKEAKIQEESFEIVI